MISRVEVVDGTGSLSSPRALAELAAAVLVEEGSPGSLGLALVPESVMADLNRRYRDEEGPTDVLSFPEPAEVDGGGWPEVEEREFALDHAPAYEALGELVVCPGVVRRYAAEAGVSPDHQLAWTVIHGTLHLLGYDHERDQGQMRDREQELLLRLVDRLRDLGLDEGP